MKYIIGIDLGTSSIKSALYNTEGKLISSSFYEYPLITPQFGWSEQDPQKWINGLEYTLKTLVGDVKDLKNNLLGLSIAGQMHSLVLLDEEDQIIRNSMLWNDVRTSTECQEIRDNIDIVDITNNKILEGFTLSKLLWIKKNEPYNWSKISKIMLPKDYIIYYLTGKHVMDYSDASGTLLLDFDSNNWSDKLLDTFDINDKWLPELKWSTDYVGDINIEKSISLGLECQVKVFAGAADNASAALSAGIINEDRSLVSIGTSGVVLTIENNNHRKYDGELHFFNHAIENMKYSMGVTLSAGNSLSWIKNIMSPELDFNEFLSGINDVSVGSDGLFFTPYIMGERTPYTDSKIRGSFIGLDINHTKKHIVRSVVEGITYSLNDCKEIMIKNGKSIKTIVSVGGGSKNREWLQIQADIFNTPIITLSNDEGPAQGAAMITCLGLGVYKSVEDCVKTFVSYSKSINPREDNVEKYREYYETYKKIYGETKKLI